MWHVDIHRRAKIEMFNERIEVTIAKKKLMPVENAKRCDDVVNGLSHRNAKRSKLAKVVGGCDGNG